jgi:RNA polymerase sigma factor (sigma-70 family)
MDITSWTEDQACRRKFPQPRTNELDDLLLTVGSRHDGAAFAALFVHFRPRVHAQLIRLGLAPAAADDLTQDVMETIWRKAHLYDPRKSGAATWILQIARNRRIDHKRRSRELSFAAEDFYAIPDPADGSDDCLDAAQREAHVRLALDTLSREQYALLRLAFFDGLSHSAIARRLNLPLGTVKSRLRFAFAKLRRLLGEAGMTKGCLMRS